MARKERHVGVHCRDIPTFWPFWGQNVGISLQSALPVTDQPGLDSDYVNSGRKMSMIVENWPSLASEM